MTKIESLEYQMKTALESKDFEYALKVKRALDQAEARRSPLQGQMDFEEEPEGAEQQGLFE